MVTYRTPISIRSFGAGMSFTRCCTMRSIVSANRAMMLTGSVLAANIRFKTSGLERGGSRSIPTTRDQGGSVCGWQSRVQASLTG